MIDDARLAALLPRLREIRHDIHQHPELGFREERTQKLVRAWLEEHGYAPRDCAGTGLVADRGEDGRLVALRADMDCLPMQEETPLPYRSVHEGCAHKCGHDGHTTILLGVAAMLAGREGPGRVRLLFQPSEEGLYGSGGRRMVEEGALEGVDEVYGLHNWPAYPKGEVRVTAGPLMAQVHSFTFTVRGVGGHGSQPQLCRDPIVAAAQLITALQTVVSRGLGYDGGAVLSVGYIHAGKAHNVIPGEVSLGGTIRSFEPAVTERMLQRLDEVTRGVAATFGVTIDSLVEPGFPVLVNDAGCAETVRRVAARVVGEERVSARELPMAGGEDFAYMARAVPGAYFFLGAKKPGEDTPVCHHPDFDFDDDLIELGVRMMLGIVDDRLAAG
ncbi:MAG: amidohydrolase [Myxococcales bacterium]|nr:amidohydrolase [Myxococcales bacterium]